MQLFSDSIIKLWNGWEVRVLILLSLLLQIILIIFGPWRKFSTRIWTRILIWSAYLAADWVATVALGNLASNQGDFESEDDPSPNPNPNNVLQAFWAPFLLLHLGGPDTITAYSLEDNELWLRHFLGLVVQVAVAFYVFLRSWSTTVLTFIAIPMFITGIIKYGERTFVLRSSSMEHFKNSLPLHPDACQDLDMFNEEGRDQSKELVAATSDRTNPKNHHLALAYFLFRRFQFLFAGRTITTHDWSMSYSIVRHKEPQDAFKLIEYELGFMYDVLYTKSVVVYSRWGLFLRCISFFSSVSSLILFSITTDVHAYPLMNVIVTFLLLVIAVLLEIYAFIVLSFSDWTKLWLIKRRTTQHNRVSETLVNHFWRFSTSCSRSFLTSSKRWSRSIGQYNLVSYCLKDTQPVCIGVSKLPFIGELLEKHRCLTWEDVTGDLQTKIFNYLKDRVDELEQHQKSSSLPYVQVRDEFLVERGLRALKRSSCYNVDQIRWTIRYAEFDTTLLHWHIATDLCYHRYLHDSLDGDTSKLDPKCKISKCLSDYMLYLLIFRSSMVPRFVGEIRYKDTCETVMGFFKKKKKEEEEEDHKKAFNGRKALLRDLRMKETYNSNRSESEDLSVLFDGCQLARDLIKISESSSSFSSSSSDYRSSEEEMWEVISEVWVEMLVYAAHNCAWKEHAQLLMKGGELLTHVYLLMTHFCLTKQYVKRP
ncbi:hypothetical protein ACOSQ2_020314 [Xanthoceras sorbifolium]